VWLVSACIDGRIVQEKRREGRRFCYIV